MDESDYALIRAMFYERQETHGEKLGLIWYQMVDVPSVMAAIRCGEVESRIVGGYLVCFQLVKPWYSRAMVLSECLVLNLYGGMDFSAVTDFLTLEAEARGAQYVSAGTALATHPKALERMYKARGFEVQATELLRKV